MDAAVQDVYFVGVDVGTGSTRAALVSSTGQVLRTHICEIRTWNPKPDYYEQSSNDIWWAVCECVRTVANGFKDKIIGIGFDATCSMVVLDKSGNPLTISTTANPNQNIILWMDHRAVDEAYTINQSKHEILNYVGGQVSLEMQCPKLLWLKKNIPATWTEAGYFFDLPDFLTWKCTNSNSRSLCSVVCKWNYDAVKNYWPKDYFETIGLHELCENNFEKIGQHIQGPGERVLNGLTENTAIELGLRVHTAVGTSMIDAHAGALGLFGVNETNLNRDHTSKLAIICGTSSCHMSVVQSAIHMPGIWGPYKGAIFPEMFLHEAGQSATGILLDHIVRNHPAYNTVEKNAGTKHVYDYLHEQLVNLARKQNLSSIHYLTKDVNVWPDFHGNRSPLANPNLRGMISGLTMTCDQENLAILYLAFVQAISYGTRHILNHLHNYGRPEFTSILICGGLSKNNLFIQTHADACNLPVLIPDEPEMVLIGAAMLGSCAAGYYAHLNIASMKMGSSAIVVTPMAECFAYHQRKYEIFLKMFTDQESYKSMIDDVF